MTDDEVAPKTMLYPRDPSLDPQLVWKGKDEQDRHPLEVPVVPIYIQEKIRPQSHRAGRVEQASRLRFGRIAWSRRPACGLGGSRGAGVPPAVWADVPARPPPAWHFISII